MKYTKNTNMEQSVPGLFGVFNPDIEVDGREVELSVWDTAGGDGPGKGRLWAYADFHFALVCFDISKPATLDNTQEEWISKVRLFRRGLAIWLVGLMLDLRDDSGGQYSVNPKEGEDVRRKISATRYFECSSEMNVGVKEVFEAATRDVSVAWMDKKGKKTLVARILNPKAS